MGHLPELLLRDAGVDQYPPDQQIMVHCCVRGRRGRTDVRVGGQEREALQEGAARQVQEEAMRDVPAHRIEQAVNT